MTNPLLFRFHRGSLDESMQTVVEVLSEAHLHKIIEGVWESKVIRMQIDPYCSDDRIGWDTHMVRVQMTHEPTELYPIGFLNKMPDWMYEDTSNLSD